jgi:uncharacterized protein YneF (UPF0154 family)
MNAEALTERTLAALIQDFMLVIALLVIVLMFGLYIYFVRSPMAEYFMDAPPSNKQRIQ